MNSIGENFLFCTAGVLSFNANSAEYTNNFLNKKNSEINNNLSFQKEIKFSKIKTTLKIKELLISSRIVNLIY